MIPAEAQRSLNVLNNKLSKANKHFIRDLCTFVTDISKIQINTRLNNKAFGKYLARWLTAFKGEESKLRDIFTSSETKVKQLCDSQKDYTIYEYMGTQFKYIIDYKDEQFFMVKM